MLTISKMEARAEMHWEAWLLVNSLKKWARGTGSNNSVQEGCNVAGNSKSSTFSL